MIGIFVIFYFKPMALWFRAILSGIGISLTHLVLMRFRKVPPSLIVSALISCAKGGVAVDKDDLEAHFLTGGNIDRVVQGLIFANASGIHLSFKEASHLDLAKKTS